MKMIDNAVRRTFLFGGKAHRPERFRALKASRVRKPELHDVLRSSRKTDLWILYSQQAALDILSHVEWRNRPACGAALLLDDVRASVLEALEGCFSQVAFSGSRGAVLSPEELSDAMIADHRGDLAIMGVMDDQSRTLTLWRGDMSKLVVPFSAFDNTSDVEKPDFDRFSIVDHGQTIRFGEYEAAFDSLLYDYDPDFRRELKKKRRKSDQSFGASLRRLRKQRRLSRDSFPPLTAKTIARIERGEVSTPRGKTLATIAERLGVEPEEIEGF
ncbi:MAG: helix-turn-helix transcriptional regulator [Phycisphaeraceae bacterium]|nr:helix-turn-helix transcriptional regulator [Phycisphaeraceae bacterium]